LNTLIVFGHHTLFMIKNWNSVPDNVINSNSIGIFKNRLDLFWKSQECYYDYKSDLAGTGSRSQL